MFMDVLIYSPHIQFRNFWFHQCSEMSISHKYGWKVIHLYLALNSYPIGEFLRSEIIYMTGLCQSVDPGSGPHMMSDGGMTGPWGLVSILAHTGRSMAAVHTSSSVTQMLDFLCLLKLTLLLMCFSESIPMIKDPFIMGGREVHLTFLIVLTALTHQVYFLLLEPII